MQERCYESGSCVQKNCASLGGHPESFSPTSVQFKGEINDALPRKRHQKRHLEFCNAYLLSRMSWVRVPPGTPSLFLFNYLCEKVFLPDRLLFRQMGPYGGIAWFFWPSPVDSFVCIRRASFWLSREPCSVIEM